MGVAVVGDPVVETRFEPLQLYALAPFAPLPVRVTVPPLHMGPLLVGAAVGTAFTVTDVVYTVDGLQPLCPVPSLTVKEYTEVAAGDAVGVALVVLPSEEPLHVNTVALFIGLAARLTVPPMQI